MKVSLNWLKEFVDVPVAPRELRRDLTMAGLNVESCTAVGDDWVLEVEVTSNRPDCLSHYGVAREVATIYRQPLRPLNIAVREASAAATAAIEIADPELCARYCGRVVQNVQVKPSPAWLVQRLEAVGQRPINNVADVTNYVLMELGHPLHAFDLARLRQQKIIVRRARSGEHLRTLDGFDRTLTPDNLVIADGERAVALAGVMGGEESEISSGTRAVLLESAWFEPASIRRTAKAQGMHTEASHRFERGADVEMAPLALDRAAALIAQLVGGEVLRGRVDIYPAPRRAQDVVLRSSEVLRILGADVPGEEIERILRALGFQARGRKDEGWRVTPPSYRPDIAREVDLVEEVARHFGYDRLPARVRPAPPRVERDADREKNLAVTGLLVGLGYREIIPPSMVDPEENGRFAGRPPVILANPLSQEASALRSTPVPSMLRALRWNLDRDQGDLRLFEIGKTYCARTEGLPEERQVLTLGLTGHRRPPSLHDMPEEREKQIDFFDLKGDLETLFEAFEIPDWRFEPDGCGYYEASESGRFLAAGETLVVFGRLSRDLARDYKLRPAVWLAEVDYERLAEFSLRTPAFDPFSRFPAVERDFSLLVPEGTTYRRLAEAVRGLGLEDIREFRPADVLPVGKIAAGHYSLLFRITFQSASRTLTSEEIDKAGQQVLAALAPLGVRLRG